jgi:iron complex transport system ATP-binding protein
MALSAHDLSYGWPGRRLGQGLVLAVPNGRVGFVLGPNGTGKTTLVRTLLGLLPPLGGRIEIDGTDMALLRRRDIARCVAWVPQASSGYFPYTALQTVLMGRAAHLPTLGAPGAADHVLARRVMDELGIVKLAEQPFSQLSGGERQLVLIARALAQQAPTLILDEPTASLDLGNAQRVLGVMRMLADTGHAVLATTHDPNEALSIGDDVALMKDGAIVAQGHPSHALNEARLLEVFGVHACLLPAGEGRRVCVVQSWQPASMATPAGPTGTGAGIR